MKDVAAAAAKDVGTAAAAKDFSTAASTKDVGIAAAKKLLRKRRRLRWSQKRSRHKRH